MTTSLETLSWIAAVAAIPVAVIGWFVAAGKGRRIENSKRLALAEIPAQEWRRAKFTYWFLKEDDGVSLDVDCYQPSQGTASLQYADLRVCQAQMLTIWPGTPPAFR